MLTYSFDFSLTDEGWVAGFADFTTYELDNYQLQHEFRERPATTGNGGSLFISGMNRSDDLFMYHKRKITGLKPNTVYRATFQIELASKYVSRDGAGGDPARSVFLKACRSIFEPTLIYSENAYRLDIDIGQQSSPGKDSTVLGDIEKPHDGTENYALITRKSAKSIQCTAANDGSLWLLFGTDSGFEGETALYFTRFEATFMTD